MSKKICTECLICGKEMEMLPWQVKQGRGKYCGRDCWYASRRGKVISSYLVDCKSCGKKD